jgi:hypothetical protein
MNERDVAARWFAREYFGRHIPGMKTDETVRELARELLDRAREMDPELELPTRRREVLADVRLMDTGNGHTQAALVEASASIYGVTDHAIRYHLARLEADGYIRRERDEEGRVRVYVIRR